MHWIVKCGVNVVHVCIFIKDTFDSLYSLLLSVVISRLVYFSNQINIE